MCQKRLNLSIKQRGFKYTPPRIFRRFTGKKATPVCVMLAVVLVLALCSVAMFCCCVVVSVSLPDYFLSRVLRLVFGVIPHTGANHSRHFAYRSRQEIADGRIPVARLYRSP